MNAAIERRLEKLEKAQSNRRIVVWYVESQPRPETKPGDLLIKVKYANEPDDRLRDDFARALP